jgi:hypothetical protein
MTYKYCIIGFGISGQILLLELIRANIPKKDIAICDENFLGGELVTKYGSVLSNTPWWKTKKALEVYTSDLPNISPDICTPVRIIAKACLQTALKASEGVDKYTTTVKSLEPGWTINHTFGTFNSEKIFLTIGGQEKNIELPLSKIPLSIALDKNQLANSLDPNDKITVFGTSHSGVVVLENLNSLGIPTIAVHKGTLPFLFETEVRGGLKEQSAITAKEILDGKYTNTMLVSWSDPIKIYKTLIKSTKVIIATGFEGKSNFGKEFTVYDPDTALISVGTNIYGFGMAYPGITTIADKKFQDVSVLSFQEQIQRCLPGILVS